MNIVFSWFCKTRMLPAHTGCTWPHDTLDTGYFHYFCSNLIEHTFF